MHRTWMVTQMLHASMSVHRANTVYVIMKIKEYIETYNIAFLQLVWQSQLWMIAMQSSLETVILHEAH